MITKAWRFFLPVLLLSSPLHGGEESAADIPAGSTPEKVGEIVIAVFSDGTFRIERPTPGAFGLPGVTASNDSLGATEADLSVPQPDQRAEQHPGEIIVNVMADGSIRAGGEIISREQLRTKLDAVAELLPDQSVRILGDGAATYGQIVEVIDTCTKAGIWNISFATRRPAPTD